MMICLDAQSTINFTGPTLHSVVQHGCGAVRQRQVPCHACMTLPKLYIFNKKKYTNGKTATGACMCCQIDVVNRNSILQCVFLCPMTQYLYACWFKCFSSFPIPSCTLICFAAFTHHYMMDDAALAQGLRSMLRDRLSASSAYNS